MLKIRIPIAVPPRICRQVASIETDVLKVVVRDTIQGQTSVTGVEQMAVSLGSRGFLYDQGSLSSGIPVFRSLDSGVCRVVGCQQEQDRLMAQEHHAPSTR